ncbi:hypothetical protein [Hyphobacterium sp.]|uniref:hypothetical protein n=1 Tax=Hyphobacterium sp. TaxID=2004662 RepID=UPI003747E1A7
MRRTIELICAGSVAIAGLMTGMVGPVESSEQSWDPRAAVLNSFRDHYSPQVSNETARTATAIMQIRQSYDPDMSGTRTRFVLADPPGPGELVIEGETRAEEAFQRAGLSNSEPPRMTTSVRLAAPMEAADSDAVVTPYAGLALTPEGTEARVGAQLRVGDGRGDESRWFLFAAAERQALFYDATDMDRPLRAIDITPYSVIGDVQVGLAYRLTSRADVALAYVRRDWAYQYGTDKWEEEEGFAAVSLAARW